MTTDCVPWPIKAITWKYVYPFCINGGEFKIWAPMTQARFADGASTSSLSGRISYGVAISEGVLGLGFFFFNIGIISNHFTFDSFFFFWRRFLIFIFCNKIFSNFSHELNYPKFFGNICKFYFGFNLRRLFSWLKFFSSASNFYQINFKLFFKNILASGICSYHFSQEILSPFHLIQNF